MPYQYILANLLAEAEHSVGVVFVDEEGETVDASAQSSTDVDLRVTAAYLGIYARHVVSLTRDFGLGSPRLLYVERNGLTVLACVLRAGYVLGLVQHGTNGVGAAERSVLRAAEDLERTVLQGLE